MLAAALAMISVTSTGAQTLTGAGATFPAPLYTKWAQAAQADTGVELNYQAIGSGGGQNQIISRTVDFGASDAPMPQDKLTAHNLVQIPTVMGAVVVIVNIPGVQTDQLHLAPSVLSDIYLGKIKKWDDARIVADNADLHLPSVAIAPVYRADGSGTTFVFASYLSKVSTEWQSNVGASTSIKWPTGTGSKGNDGVSASVKQVKGAIGYVESAYASQNHLVTAQLKNQSGAWVRPNNASFQSAAQNADWSHAANFAVDLINQPGNNSWPIMSATFLLVPTNPTDKTRTQLMTKWLTWAYHKGNDMAHSMDYVPLPRAVQDASLNSLAGIH
jgi:phosphate transport system substrate-binding protein